MERMSYDQCAYKTAVGQSVAPISYILDPIRYENINKCRPELGIVGGTAVSHVAGNLVDLENDLFNINRPNTKCAAYEWQGMPASGFLQGIDPYKTTIFPKVDTTPLHLRACQFADYPSVPLPPPPTTFSCSAPGISRR